MNHRTWLAAIIAAGVAVRAIAFFVLQPAPESDYLAYYQMASRLAAGEVMRDTADNVAFMSAGYPMLLGVWFSLFGAGIRAAFALNVLLFGLTAACLFLLGRQLGGRPAAGLLAAALWAGYLEAIVYSTYCAKENLTIALIASQLALPAVVGRVERATAVLLGAASGLLFGFGVLAGIAYAAFLPGIAWLLWRSCGTRDARLRCGALLIVGAASVLAPWIMRNHALLGAPVVSTSGGFNLYIGNHPGAPGFFVSIADTPLRDAFHAARRAGGELAADRLARAGAIDYLQREPAQALSLAAGKLAKFWWLPLHEGERPAGIVETLVRRAWALQFTLAVAACLCLPLVSRRAMAALMPVFACLTAYWLLHGLFYVVFRYRFGVMPLVLLGAAASVTCLFRHWPTAAWRRAVARPRP